VKLSCSKSVSIKAVAATVALCLLAPASFAQATQYKDQESHKTESTAATIQEAVIAAGQNNAEVVKPESDFRMEPSKDEARLVDLHESMRQQWECHVLGGLAEWGTFDLEMSGDPTQTGGAVFGTVLPLSSTCNW